MYTNWQLSCPKIYFLASRETQSYGHLEPTRKQDIRPDNRNMRKTSNLLQSLGPFHVKNCEALRFTPTPAENIFVGRYRFESQPVFWALNRHQIRDRSRIYFCMIAPRTKQHSELSLILFLAALLVEIFETRMEKNSRLHFGRNLKCHCFFCLGGCLTKLWVE